MPNKPIADIHTQMQRIRLEKEKQQNLSRNSTKEHLETVQAVRGIVSPLIQEFVNEDDHLSIQSSNNRNFFIGYAALHVCRIVLSARDPDSVQIIFESDSGQNSTVYYGTVDAKTITSTVQNALLSWYQSVS